MSVPKAANSNSADFIALGRAVLQTEAMALEALISRLDDRFNRACKLLLSCREQGRIVVIGMGKSGHIGNKIAATLASTGSPAFFVHPAEASHGDMGMITPHDVVVALSNSGETEEILILLPLLKRLAVPLIALVGNPQSSLAAQATVCLDASVAREACPLGLAPTASTTATLALGDALAVALLQARGFSRDDFARSHPGGRLGRRLLIKVADIMRVGRDNVPQNAPTDVLSEALLEMTSKKLGMTIIVNSAKQVLGIFADGDLRRALDSAIDIHSATMAELMTSPCKTAVADMLAVDAVQLMETHKIFMLPVVDQHAELIGAFNMHDLLQAKVV